MTDTTLSAFARSLAPAWDTTEGWLRPWLVWPPDAFALTSAVLDRTGCYRYVLSDRQEPVWRWQARVERTGVWWMESASAKLAGRPPLTGENGEDPADFLRALQDTIERHADVTLEELRILTGERCEGQEARPVETVCRALLDLHAVADEACTGLGLARPPFGARSALAHLLANLLLVSKGSLASLPKHAGVVLPKMRTPQRGLTLRTLSHHVTCHVSEVEVMWRSVPWAAPPEKTLNVLAVPWPPKVEAGAFEEQPDAFHPVRQFRYQPEAAERAAGQQGRASTTFHPDRVVNLLRNAEEHCDVHVVVLPECALSVEEYRDLLTALSAARRNAPHLRNPLPLVVAGVYSSDGERNQVRLAAHFAARWYEISQRKHHRWKLDRNQVRQYGLEGRLSTARNWYEGIALGQRRLTFVVPNGWLALTPLICEDLAQLEPVSDLVRGVGPTLLMALLADGPQLEARWAARYASVFADDPGTAVLTLTSLGMARRSRRLDHTKTDERETEPKAHVVALWKDLLQGTRLLDLHTEDVGGGAISGILLSLSADWKREHSADGRHDHENAATMKLEGVRTIRAEHAAPTAVDAGPDDEHPSVESEDPRAFGDWADIRELTAATFALRAVLHLYSEDLDHRVVDQALGWVLGGEHVVRHDRWGPRLSGVVDQVLQAFDDPEQFGIARSDRVKNREEQRKKDLGYAAELLKSILSDWQPEVAFWPWLHDTVVARLNELFGEDPDRSRDLRSEWSHERRNEYATLLAVLTCIYDEAGGHRFAPQLQHAHEVGAGNPQEPPSHVMTREQAVRVFRRIKVERERFF